jgi:hypothetical protein
MLKHLNFHNIVSVHVTETQQIPAKKGDKQYCVRDIVIENEKGERFTVTLFSNLNGLDIKVPETAPDFIGMLDELTIRS